ncbi:MAG TPA: hypothetical protein VEJ88_01720 [Dissulfurispiraceae bacterium]|nr:hypothetical protein [Dissulfurispiraceae bacterium]
MVIIDNYRAVSLTEGGTSILTVQSEPFVRKRPCKYGGGTMRTLKKSTALEKFSAQRKKTKLEIVLKCDAAGSMEAVTNSLHALTVPEVDISVVHSGIGAISQSDVLFAETASGLIVGFQTGVMQSLDKVLREHRVEVRLYDVIYNLIDDINAVAGSLVPIPPEDQIIGSGKIIALFKSSRKGIILGCDVREGVFAVGEHFRVISAMGTVYEGTIESLHVGDTAVNKALPGQQAGIRIKHFSTAKIGDLVESFRPSPPTKTRKWEPTGQIIRK